MSTSRPRRSKANLHPGDIVIASQQTRRSSDEVAKEKAALLAQRDEALQRHQAQLEELRQLDEQLKTQAEEDATYAARPPPTQLTSTTSRTRGAGVASSTTSETTVTSAGAQAHASGESAGRKVQPGRVRRLTRADVDAHRDPGDAVLAATRRESSGHGLAKENVAPINAAPAVGTETNRSGGAKKRKAENGGETSAAKKGKPTKPSGPTAAAAAAFASPVSKRPQHSQATSSLPPSRLAVSSTTPASASSAAQSQLPQGVYTQTTVILDDSDFEDLNAALVERPAAAPLKVAGAHQHDNTVAAAPKNNNIIQLEVVDVTSDDSFNGMHGPATTAQPLAQAAHPAATIAQPAQVRSGPWTAQDLEPIMGPFASDFTPSLVPKLINIVGNQACGPWRLKGLDMKRVLQELAAELWPTLTINVVPRQPFYDVAKQKLWDYRNGMAKEALLVVNTYMLSRRFDSTEDRAEYVSWALSEKDQWPFRYERVVETETNTIVFHGAYQGTIVSRVFAYHLKRIGIPVHQIRDHPCNALALATTAAERALKMWSTGNLLQPRGRSEESKFSDRLWGKTAHEYMGSIIDLTEEQWDKILAKADRYARGLDAGDSDMEDEDEVERADLPTTGRAALPVDADLEVF